MNISACLCNSLLLLLPLSFFPSLSFFPTCRRFDSSCARTVSSTAVDTLSSCMSIPSQTPSRSTASPFADDLCVLTLID